MFGIQRLFGRKTEDSRLSSARERFAQLEAEFIRGLEAETLRFSQQERAPLIEGEAANRRIAAATIALDPDGNRATDTTSGMAVAFIREDYPLERGEFWTLAWKGEEREFRVGWADAFMIISRDRDDLSFDDAVKLANELNLREYSVPSYPANSHEFLENIDVFVNLFAAVARHRLNFMNVYICFEPWGVDRQYHRRLKFAPSKAAE